MREKGVDLSRVAPKGLSQVAHLDEQDVIVALTPDAKRLFPQTPRKAVFLDWNVPNPIAGQGAPEKAHAAYEKTYHSIREHVKELVDAIIGNENP
jgi:protein-tyrosine-phosphatase